MAGEAVQRLAKGFQAQRLHVVLDVGVRLAWVAAGERAQLARCHAHRAAAPERIFQSDHGLAPQRIGLRIEGFDVLHLVHRANLQMVLQIGPHARCVMPHGDAVLL